MTLPMLYKIAAIHFFLLLVQMEEVKTIDKQFVKSKSEIRKNAVISPRNQNKNNILLQNIDKLENTNRQKRSPNFDPDSLYLLSNGHLIPYNERNNDNKDSSYNDNKGKFVREITTEPDTKSISSDSTVSTTTSNDTSESNTKETKNSNITNLEEETKLLHKIMEEVEDIMNWKHTMINNKADGAICNINGSWVSEAAGMQFDITFNETTRKKFRIQVSDRVPVNEDGFLCDGNWTLFGEIPFQHSGLVIVLAVHQKDKHISTFIGECKICEGSETVSGTWMIGRSSRDCKDQKASIKILSDVWRKEQIHALRKKHLLEIGVDPKNT